MKTTNQRPGRAGFSTYLLVLSTGMILTLLAVYAFRRALGAQSVQAAVQTQSDYSEKEEAILRSIVAITPNRAIRAMQGGSNVSSVSDPLRWQNIFTEALDMANARTAIAANVRSTMNLTNHRLANSGDSTLSVPSRIFKALSPDTGYTSAGINRSFGTGYPPSLTTASATTIARDALYPIITSDKEYGALAQAGVGLPVSSYPKFNLISYPKINFGYAKPGDPFVAKRNWWAFNMSVSAHDQTFGVRPAREMVLSIYEIPSQLAISAASFMALGRYASGEAWQNVTIDGGVFTGKATVEGNTSLTALASRRGMNLASDSRIGGQSFASADPFAPGTRENYQLTQGDFFPVSLASESGRSAFIPISRGVEVLEGGERVFPFYDRFSNATESNSVSPTTWNRYSSGAMQCAMRLDITQCVSATDKTPATVRFSYLTSGGVRVTDSWPLINKNILLDLPSGYTYKGEQTGYPTPDPGDQSFTFNTPTDLAYGVAGIGYSFILGFTGTIRFNNDTFGNPAPGITKSGYARPSSPFQPSVLASGKNCITVLPERIPSFLAAIGAGNTSINHSLVVNVDYTTTTGSVWLNKPTIPCTDLDYGLILKECSDLTGFTKGFSIVSNLRTYIGADLNTTAATPPSGYTPTGTYYPPFSIFVPEKRFGVDFDPLGVTLAGQIGSLASEDDATPIRPMDSKTVSGSALGADRITVNLRPIRHPAEMPPVTMMNWLVVLDEKRQ